jgi:hypothetical protein
MCLITYYLIICLTGLSGVIMLCHAITLFMECIINNCETCLAWASLNSHSISYKVITTTATDISFPQ